MAEDMLMLSFLRGDGPFLLWRRLAVIDGVRQEFFKILLVFFGKDYPLEGFSFDKFLGISEELFGEAVPVDDFSSGVVSLNSDVCRVVQRGFEACFGFLDFLIQVVDLV